QLGLLLRVVEALAVVDLDAEVLRGLQRALLDDGPKRVACSMGDDGEGARRLGRGRALRGGSRRGDRRAEERGPCGQQPALDEELATAQARLVVDLVPIHLLVLRHRRSSPFSGVVRRPLPARARRGPYALRGT